MHIKRQLGALLGIAAAIATVAGCGSSSSSPASASAGGTGGKHGPWVIGYSNGYYGNGARVQIEAETKAYAALPSVKSQVKQLIFNNAGTGVAAQVAAVDGMIAQHVNAIILDSNSLTALNPAIVAAHRAGIPVIAENDQVSSPEAYQVQTVGKTFGATMAQAFVKLLHGKGNIVVMRGIAGNAVDAAEASGFNPVFQQNPGIHVLNVSYPQWDDAQAQSTMSNLLSRYSNIDGVFTEGGMQQGVVRAYVAAHRRMVPVSGTDENGFACQLKQYGSQGLQGVQVGSQLWEGALALKVALGVLSGHSEPKSIPGKFVAWNTAQSISHCQSGVSPSLFLQVANPADGVNLTAAEVEKYMH